MRRWSLDEHWGSARPQINSLRPKLAFDAVLLGENRFPLSSIEGLPGMIPREPSSGNFNTYYELILRFETLEVVVPPECGANLKLFYNDIEDWNTVDMTPQVYKGIAAPSGLEIWIIQPEPVEECALEAADSDRGEEDREGDKDIGSDDGSKTKGKRLFLAIRDEDLALVRFRSVVYLIHYGSLGLGPLGSGLFKCVFHLMLYSEAPLHQVLHIR